jgi:DNA-binding transcriptional MerR regulator
MDGQELWTLDQLAEQVEVALSVDYPGAPSGRIRSVPDRRAIRWYTTIGLVDRPASTRGRTALYGERHLQQLVAIKRLQAAGRSLAQIQAELAGATDSSLQSLARLPDQRATPPAPPAAPRTTRFWSAPAPVTQNPLTQPATSAVPATAAVAAEDALAVATSDPYPTPPPAPTAVRPLSTASGLPATDTVPQEIAQDRPDQVNRGAAGGAAEPAAAAGVAPAIALPGGVTLLLPPGTPYPAASDLTAIRTAAVPLLAELGRRGVIATDSTEGNP